MVSQNYFQNVGGFRHHHNFGNPFARRKYAFAVPARGTAVRKRQPWETQESDDEDEQDSKEIEPEKPPRSAFRTAIRSAQQGIAYLILDNGYDYMLAMQDALDEQKFQLFLTLI